MLKDKLFPAQEATEEILYIIRRHWFTYAIFWFVALMMTIPVILTVIYYFNHLGELSNNGDNLIIIGTSIYTLFGLGLMIYGFIDFYLDVYIVTDRRIVDIKQNGLFKRAISELNFRQIQDVNAKVNGVFPTLLHYGDVYIQTAGELANFNFQSIPHPYEMSKIIIDLHTISLRRAKATATGKNGTDTDGERDNSVDEFPTPSPETIAYINKDRILSGTNKTSEELSILGSRTNLYKNKDKILSGINKTLEEQGQLTEGKSVDL